jgi:DNA polymerase-3 subunit epsilon
VETTGLKHGHDQIVEFAAVQFTYDASNGFVYEVRSGYQGFQEPTVPISAEARSKHRITDDMLKGETLDADRIAQLLDGVSLVVAFNSDFDRRMIERQFPAFANVAWADACFEIDWEAAGSVGRKLENVLAHCCGVFYEAHRAMDDVVATLHALATADIGETPALLALLEAARMPTTRIWAIRSPFEMKDELKERGYRWHERKKTWYKDVRAERGTDAVSVELVFLECNGVRPDLKTLTAKERFSVRADA